MESGGGFLLNFYHPGVRRIGALMAPSILGLGVTQLNVLVSTFLASYLPEGSVSYLYYADRLLEFPMGIFAIAIATAVLPTMSDQRAKNDISGIKETLAFSLRLTFFCDHAGDDRANSPSPSLNQYLISKRGL